MQVQLSGTIRTEEIVDAPIGLPNFDKCIVASKVLEYSISLICDGFTFDPKTLTGNIKFGDREVECIVLEYKSTLERR